MSGAQKLVFLSIFTVHLMAAEKYALLIGISQYLPGQGLKNLDGPVSDVDALASALSTDYGFKPKNIHILKDRDASKAGILAAFDQLIPQVSQGDYVLIYYSGHGTSPQDRAWKERLPVDADSGAIIPADFKRGSAQEVVDRLVIGRRDLRPRLVRLDGRATVFGILDTCFSANLMKDVLFVGAPRSVPVSQLVASPERGIEEDIGQDVQQLDHTPATADHYPYKTVAWISAAQAGEQAVDLDLRVLGGNPNATVDRKPHGQFTNAVLKGLQGDADRNHDNLITHAELFEYLTQQAKNWSHTPAWSASEDNRDLPKSAALAGRTTPMAQAGRLNPAGKLCVRMEKDAPELAAQMARLPGVAVSCEPANLVVRPAGSLWRLFNAGGVLVGDSDLTSAVLVARVAAEPNVRRLIEYSYSAQKTNLSLSLWEENARSHREIFLPGGEFNIHLRPDNSVWPLVIDIDVTGMISVLYPRISGGQIIAGAINAGSESDLGANGALCPCGLEYLKAFAFGGKPEGYEAWAGKQFPATSPDLQKLLDLARSAQGETALRIVTRTAK